MDLYNLKNNRLEPVQRKSFQLEKNIQDLIENNVDILFNLEFISTEFSVSDFRLDTLCFDNETNSFIIIEYKRGSSYSVIDQGYSYMSVMLNNKSDFILEYIEKTGRSIKREEIDWSQSRILFISQSFNSYQKNSINFKDVPFQLWEIKKFSNSTISLNQHLPSSKESIQNIEGDKNSIIKDVGKEVKVFEEDDHTSKIGKKLLLNWNKLKDSVLKLEGLEIIPKRGYITFMLGNKTVGFCTFRKEHIFIVFNRGNLKNNGTKSRNFFEIDDPKTLTKIKEWTYKDGTKGSEYKFRFDKNSDIDYTMFLIKQKYNNILN